MLFPGRDVRGPLARGARAQGAVALGVKRAIGDAESERGVPDIALRKVQDGLYARVWRIVTWTEKGFLAASGMLVPAYAGDQGLYFVIAQGVAQRQRLEQQAAGRRIRNPAERRLLRSQRRQCRLVLRVEVGHPHLVPDPVEPVEQIAVPYGQMIQLPIAHQPVAERHELGNRILLV